MKTSLKWAFVLGFVGFITSFGAHIVAANLPFYAEKVGIGLTMIGVLIAVYDFAEILAKPVFGGLADKKGMKKAMLAGIILFTLASLMYPFVSPKLLVVVRFLQGLGAAALSAVSLAMVGTMYKNNRGKAYGIYNAIKGAGYVLSPVIGGVIVMKTNFSGIFYATAGIGVIGFFIALTLPKDKEKNAEVFDDDDDFSIKSLFSVFKNKTLMPWFLIIVMNMFFVGILFGFLPVRIHELGYDAFHTGLLVSVTTISYLLIQPVAGWLADKFDPIVTLRSGMLLSCLTTTKLYFCTLFYNLYNLPLRPMKFFAFIMAFLVLALSVMPCADAGAAIYDGKAKSEITKTTDARGHTDADACSPFCYCACCASFSINHFIVSFNIIPPNVSNPISSFLPADVIEVALPVWQPPQIV
jgi:MFS family permease